MAKDSKKTKIQRHDPLHTQMEQDNQIKQKQRQPKVKNVVQQEEYLDTKTSNRILNLVQEQQREIEKEECE
jgi:essential nuclear protein 1